MKQALLAALFPCFALPINAHSVVDSLHRVLRTPANEQARVHALLELGSYYRMRLSDSAAFYGERALTLSQKIEYPNGEVESLLLLGIHAHSQAHFERSRNYYRRARRLAALQGLSGCYGACYLNMGNSFSKSGEADSAFFYFTEALKAFEQHGDTAEAWKAQMGLGNLFRSKGDAKSAETHFVKALSIIEEQEPKSADYGFLLYQLADFYFFAGRYDEYAGIVEQWQQFERERKTAREILNANYHISLYYAFSQNQAESIKRLKKAAEYFSGQGNEFRAGFNYDDLGYLLARAGEKREALEAYRLAEHYYTASGARPLLARTYQRLYQTGKQLGDTRLALAYLEKYNSLSDSIFREETEHNIAELRVQYDTEKKEQSLQLKEVELQQKTQQRNYFIFISIALGLAMLIGFWALRLRLRARQQIASREAEIRERKINELEQEKQLLAYSAMIEGQEQERARIARGLHDGLGGLLTSIKAHMNALNGNAEKTGMRERIDQLIDEAYIEVRRISHNLMPAILAISGIEDAIRELAARLKANGLHCQLELIGLQQEPPKTKSLMAYRILQELTNNIIRHAEASEVLIQLIIHKSNLTAIVEDDGKGFSLPEALQTPSLGLKNIQSRVDYLKGSLNIDSTPGEGTVVTIEVPGFLAEENRQVYHSTPGAIPLPYCSREW